MFAICLPGGPSRHGPRVSGTLVVSVQDPWTPGRTTGQARFGKLQPCQALLIESVKEMSRQQEASTPETGPYSRIQKGEPGTEWKGGRGVGQLSERLVGAGF